MIFLLYLCTLGPFKTQELEHETTVFAVRYDNSLVGKHVITFSSLFFVSAQLVDTPLVFQKEFAAK